jgi:protein-tyrosine phosphatase
VKELKFGGCAVPNEMQWKSDFHKFLSVCRVRRVFLSPSLGLAHLLMDYPRFAGMKILMVCLGNICRSPLAEGILESKAKKLGLSWEVDSAGTRNNYHIGEAPHPLSQKVAKLNAVDISRQSARAFVAEDFERFDKIYAMSSDILEHMKNIGRQKYEAAKTDLLLNEIYPGKNMDVPDPWYGEEPGYHKVYEMIEKACEKIIEKYGYLKTA